MGMTNTNPYATAKTPTYQGLKRFLWVVLTLCVTANVALSFGPVPDWTSVFPGAMAVAAIAGLCAIYVHNRD